MTIKSANDRQNVIMKNKASEQDVINLLSGVKNRESGYPSDMISSHRDSFVKQAAAMAVLARAGLNAKTTTSTASGQSGTASATGASNAGVGLSIGRVLETILVAAIVVEAGAAAYIYRDKIADFINSKINPTVEVVASPPGGVVITTGVNASTPTAAFTATATGTPIPSITLPPVVNTIDINNPQVNATPEPTKPGLRLGQTKQPTP